MYITSEAEMIGMRRAAEAVALTLLEMSDSLKPGVTTKQLDEFGGHMLNKFGAISAPLKTYGFPGYTCISMNDEVAHGIPADDRVIQEGDLINIDVSAELNGFWADNGASYVVGEDVMRHGHLVDTSKNILKQAISRIKGGVKINEIGHFIEMEAKKNGFKVIKNLSGHGIGRALHEEPDNILNYKEAYDRRRFRKNAVIALETFINTRSTMAVQQRDGFTLLGNKGGFAVQHEHTLLITDDMPVVLTSANGIY